MKSHPKAELVPAEKVPIVLALFREKEYFEQFYRQNLELTNQALRNSVNEDQLIIQTISNVGEINRITNMLTKRLREWYSWYLPELSEAVLENEVFAQQVVEKKKEEIMKEFPFKETMGAELDKVHVEEMIILAQEINRLYALRKKHEAYLEKVMKKYCPNLLELAGVIIGAKLIELGKSLKRLAMLPASTIQLLGAEKALFRQPFACGIARPVPVPSLS